MINVENSCHYCTKRKLGCHTNCKEYKEFRKVLEQAKKRERRIITNDTLEYDGIVSRKKGMRK